MVAVLGAGMVTAARSGDRADLAALGRLAVVGAWFGGLMLLLRRPPRPRAPRVGGVPVLRASAVRRLALPLVLLPLVVLVVQRAFQEGTRGGVIALGAFAGMAGLAWLATRADRRFHLTDRGVELHVRGARLLLPYDRIREVQVATYRRHAGLVLVGEEGHPGLGISAWLDGIAELARALLERAPARALDGPGVREALEELIRASDGARAR